MVLLIYLNGVSLVASGNEPQFQRLSILSGACAVFDFISASCMWLFVGIWDQIKDGNPATDTMSNPATDAMTAPLLQKTAEEKEAARGLVVNKAALKWKSQVMELRVLSPLLFITESQS